MKYELQHADTCLPDYWPGHHRAHVRIPVWPGMSGKDIRESLKSEINEGAVMGGDTLAGLLSDCPPPGREKDAERAHKAAIAAVNRMRPAVKGTRRFFLDIDSPSEDEDTVYAFFVFVEI